MAVPDTDKVDVLNFFSVFFFFFGGGVNQFTR